MLKAFHILRLLKSENVSDSATVVHIVNAPYLLVNLGNFSTPPIVHILITVYHSERFRSQK